MKSLFVRINDQIYDSLEDFIQKEQINKKEAIEKAIQLLISNQSKNIDYEKSDIKDVSLKQIITKYNGYCSNCGRKIAIGEIAFWGKGILLCYDCYIKQNEKIVTDAKKELEHYKKLKKLRILINQAQKELDELVQKINVYETIQYISQISDQIKKQLQELTSYAYEVERENIDLKKILDELVRVNDRIDEFLGLFKISLKEKQKVIAYR